MNDTVELLKECNSGIKMGVNSIDSVLPFVTDEKLRESLNACKDEHATLGDETHKMLLQYKAETKDPHPYARTMAGVKTKGKMMIDGSDEAIADVMTDGCNMGVKSISRYLNKYKAAKDDAKDIAYRLISLEKNLAENLRPYL